MGISRQDLGNDLVGDVAWTALCLQAVKCGSKEAAIALLRHQAQMAIDMVRVATPPGAGMLVAERFRLMCGFEDGQPFFDLVFPLQSGDLVVRLGFFESKALAAMVAKAHDQMRKQPDYSPDTLPVDDTKLTGVVIGDDGIPQSVVDLSVEP